jgi:hypothetical protein
MGYGGMSLMGVGGDEGGGKEEEEEQEELCIQVRIAISRRAEISR